MIIECDARAPDFDAMAELWFDDLEAILRARRSAEWSAATADEANFVDPSRTADFITRSGKFSRLEPMESEA